MTPTLHLRRAVRADIDTIYRWRAETVAWLARRHPATDQWKVEYPREKIERWVARGESFMASLEPGGEPVATITSSATGDPELWTPEERAEPARYVSKANVVRAHAGREIGATLFAWARHTAAAAGASVVRIDVFSTNTALHAYYLGLGFRYLRTVPDAPYASGALFEAPAESRPGLPIIDLF